MKRTVSFRKRLGFLLLLAFPAFCFSQNVGIGTAYPDARLHVKAVNNPIGTAFFITDHDSLPLFKVRNDGNVGVGLNNPRTQLHVQGRVRVSSLSQNGFKLVYADGFGTLDTLPMGPPGTVMVSNGPGLPPTWAPLPSRGEMGLRDQIFPDFTNPDSLIPVHERINAGQPWLVPAGYNFYYLGTYVGGGNAVVQFNDLNPNGVLGGQGVIMLAAGDSITLSQGTNFPLIGILAPAKVEPITIHLNSVNNTYTVPAGKRLTICRMGVPSPHFPRVNNVPISGQANPYPVLQMVEGGETLTFPGPAGTWMQFTGYLK